MAMLTLHRRYGSVVELVTIEKPPRQVRVHASRKRNPVHGARRLDNIRRTRQICVRRVLAALEVFGRPLLVTLTFAGDASDAAYANDALRGFQVRLRAAYPLAAFLFIPELSPRGRIHFHGLLFNMPLHLGDTRQGRRIVSYGEERRTRVLAGLWREGFVDAVQTDGSGRLAYYISKYLTKGAGEVMFNPMRLIRASRNMPKETVIRGTVAEMLARGLAGHTPAKTWSGQHAYLGRIEKSTYHLEPS